MSREGARTAGASGAGGGTAWSPWRGPLNATHNLFFLRNRIVTFHQANGIQRELPAAPKRTTGYPPQCFCDLSGDKGTLGLSQESPWRLALTLK